MEYLEAVIGPNQPGRAGQHIWKPETPVSATDPMLPDAKASNSNVGPNGGTKHAKNVDIKNGFRPMYPANMKPLDGKDFGYKIKRVPTKPTI